MFRFELRWRQVPETGVRPDLVVVPPPGLDADLRVRAIPEPLQREVLVAQLPVERFVGSVLSGLARVDVGRFDLGGLQPSQDRPRHELFRGKRS
jgi:hypothetical protein